LLLHMLPWRLYSPGPNDEKVSATRRMSTEAFDSHHPSPSQSWTICAYYSGV